MGKLLCEKNSRDVWCRNESVRAEIGPILQTHTHTRVSFSSIDNCCYNTEHYTMSTMYMFHYFNSFGEAGSRLMHSGTIYFGFSYISDCLAVFVGVSLPLHYVYVITYNAVFILCIWQILCITLTLAGLHVSTAPGRGRQLGHDRSEGEGDDTDCQVHPGPQRNLQGSRHHDNRPGIPQL